MGKKSAPKPPDPNDVASAQTNSNLFSGIANSIFGHTDQNTPDGSLKYSQSGSFTIKNPFTGEDMTIPQFTATTSLSPEQQKLKAAHDQAALGLTGAANRGIGGIGSLTSDFHADRKRVERALLSRINPSLQHDQNALESSLSNRGIGLGTEAYNQAMKIQGQKSNDARYGAVLAGGQEQTREQAMQSQRINQIIAMLGGGQVSQPNFVPTNAPQIPTTDYAGIQGQNYQNKLQAWQQRMQGSQSLGGLFGQLGAAGIGAF
jgi:hypothetical protein